MTPLGSLGSSQVTTTELFVIEWVDTFRGALENICRCLKNICISSPGHALVRHNDHGGGGAAALRVPDLEADEVLREDSTVQ